LPRTIRFFRRVFFGAGFFATGLAAAFDLLGLAVSFGMSILG
jgi:hypothetical protein